MYKILGFLLVAVMILGAAGCTPAATPTPEAPTAQVEQPTSPPPQPAPTTETPPTVEPTKETVTLRVWDSFTEEGQSKGMEKFIAAFEAKYPNVKIEREAQSIDTTRPILQTALASGTGPDVVYYDTGPGFAGVLAKAGLLLPLDDAYKSYGWDKRIFPWTQSRVTFDGKIYGIGNELEFVWVYYNKAIFEKLGVSEPKTYEEFTAICDKAKAAGLTPIAFADKDKWPAYHQFSILANNIVGPEKLMKTINGETSWDDPDYVKAVQMFFIDMNKAGYLLKNTTAISYDDGNAVFYNGQAAMHMTGTWLLRGMKDNAKGFDVGGFFFPSIEGKPTYPPAGLGSGYFVSAKTAHPKEAADFLDFLFAAENAKIWLEDMSIIPPYAVDPAQFNIDPLLKAGVTALSNQPMGYNVDVLTPAEFNTAMGDGFQAVLLGKKTAEQQIKDMEAAFKAGTNK